MQLSMLHTLYAWVHQDMVWGVFVASVIEDCDNLGWFGNDKRTTTQRMMAAFVDERHKSATTREKVHTLLTPPKK